MATSAVLTLIITFTDSWILSRKLSYLLPISKRRKVSQSVSMKKRDKQKDKRKRSSTKSSLGMSGKTSTWKMTDSHFGCYFYFYKTNYQLSHQHINLCICLKPIFKAIINLFYFPMRRQCLFDSNHMIDEHGFNKHLVDCRSKLKKDWRMCRYDDSHWHLYHKIEFH